ncbi:breast carcinoma-amplified sequence 1 isoform X2 [Triplophysa rosa]|uniref:breast carcinoma-amplified sequence 1 isoform X2 n=1 Tax=Triplophysa rosa TaxID=992332 RepID=UPI002545F683|nr:breast carcinoma-amplified sequence 1 isoform X2 [Triplophysa rosa]
MGNEQSSQKKRQKANAAETKVQNGELNGHAVPPSDSTEPVCKEAQQQKSEIPPATDRNKPQPPSGKEEVDKGKEPAHAETPPEKDTTNAADAEPPKEVPKPTGEDVSNFFGKMFKKKAEPVKLATESKDSVDGQVPAEDEKSEPVAIKANAEAVPEPEGTALELLEDLAEVAEEVQQLEDTKAAEKTVMNFFKTFVSPTKTSKDAKATPDASKDQSQKEMPPAPSGNVQEAPKAPPPPPPAPPKIEGKADAAVKKEETSATAATAATKAAEASAKTKTKDSSFRKLFRPKPDVVEEKKPVEVQVDASKTSTLEAAAKPEEPQAPKPEEKKPEKKSAFGMFKPKVLLGQMSTRIQAAASSAAATFSLVSPRSAPEPKKETPAAPAAAESAPVAKAKEEPKPAAPAAPAAPDNKSAESSENASPSIPRKLEKRNSIQLFFKNLGQKRHSDAGVQTEAVAPEKAK